MPAILMTMSNEDLERIRIGYEAFNRGDFDNALAGMDPEIEWHVLDLLPETETYRGPAAVREFWETWSESFEDFHVEPEEMIDAGDKVVVVIRVRGRGRGSGAEVETPSFSQVWTLRDGRPIRVEMFQSRDAALEAAGLPTSDS